MGFLKKIFKKKKKGPNEIPGKPNSNQQNAQANGRDSNIQSQASTDVRQSRTSPSKQPPRIRDKRTQELKLEPDRIAQRNRPYNGNSRVQNVQSSGRTPADENHDYSNAGAVQLDIQHIQQMERQHSTSDRRSVHQPIFKMSAEMPKQQVIAMDEMHSHGSSSSFNLSTDAEDSEYEDLRSRGVLPGTVTSLSALDMSLSISATSNPISNAGTDQETVFPALDDTTMQSVTTGSKEQSKTSALDPARSQQEEMVRKLGFMPPPPPTAVTMSPPTPEDEPGYIPSPPKRKTDFDNWAISPSTEASNEPAGIKGVDSNSSSWAISPSTQASNDRNSKKSAVSHQHFGFDNQSNGSGAIVKRNPQQYHNTSRNNSSESALQIFPSPKAHVSNSAGFSDGFADFADFGNFHEWGKETKESAASTSARGDFDRAFDNFLPATMSNQQNSTPTAASQVQTERSLSELLALAKSKDRSHASSTKTRSRTRRTQGLSASNASVNSAPGYSSSYLRQFQNLGNHSNGGYGLDGMKATSPRISNEETSISDIIQSLEMSNQMRRGNGNLNSSRSVGDASSSAISRRARERLREKRRKEYENSGAQSSDDSDVSDDGNSESWLFDGVTGTLGPRGIAADLESLSGRSSRSKNSQGNRSHRSRPSRSRKSRKPRTSNESISSRESRHSRGSRYSHRSARSYISQMSEQSRSVANDLLRLEMQLAMVGQENRDDMPVLGSSNSAVENSGGSTPRHHSRSKPYSSSQHLKSSTSRRSKVTVIAPPGKLGIILANKADAKGTVVSGVRASSALVDKIAPGDRIISIDGEDVSRMAVAEITVIMSRKAEYERNLTVLTLNKHNTSGRHRDTTAKDRHNREQNDLSSFRQSSYEHQSR